MRQARKEGKHQPIGKTKQDIILIILEANTLIKTKKIRDRLEEKSNVRESKLIGKHLKKLNKDKYIEKNWKSKGHQAEWFIKKDFVTMDKIAQFLSDRRRDLLKTAYIQESINEEFLKYYLKKYLHTISKDMNNNKLKNHGKIIYPMPKEVMKKSPANKSFKRILKNPKFLLMLIPQKKMNDILNMIKSSPSAFTFIIEIDKNKHLWNSIYSTLIQKTKPLLDVMMEPMKNMGEKPLPSEKELEERIDKATEKIKQEWEKESFMCKFIEALFISDIITEKALNTNYVNQFTLRELKLYTKNETPFT